MLKRLSDLPTGAKIKETNTKYGGRTLIWIIADKNHKGYPNNTVTLISDKILSLKAFDGREPSNNDSNRQSYGNNYYKYSNLLQWLNSGSSNWYSAQHGADAPPNSSGVSNGWNPYDSEPGFLYNFSSDFKNAMVSTSLKTARHSLDGGGSETVTSKIFLASTTEVGLDNENGIAEGTRFPIFDGDESRKAKPTAEAVSKSNYTDSSLNASSPWWWWLRTPYTYDSYRVRCVGTGDSLSRYYARNGSRGVRPLCNLKSEILVSENKDSDGTHTIVWDSVPIIESTNKEDMGQQDKEFSFTYKVTEEDEGQTLKVEEYVDNKKTKEFDAESGSTYTFTLSRIDYQKLLNGNHNVKILAIDNIGGVTEKVFNFSKNETKILFTLNKPLAADAMVTKALINVLGAIPENAIFKVEACNNGNDPSPTWEDCTEKVLSEREILLLNKQKTDSQWGFNVRVSLDRNGATGDCYISSVGGNFE